MGRLVWRLLAGGVGVAGVVAAGLLWQLSSVIGVLTIVGGLATVISWCSTEQVAYSAVGQRIRRCMTHGALAAVTVMAVGGLCTVVGVMGLAVVVLLIGTSPPVIRQLVRVGGLTGSSRHATRADGISRQDAERVRQMSTAELCQGWITSCHRLRQIPTPSAGLPLVQLRQLYLDELERRDPEGFNAWLASAASAAGDPTRFLTK